MKKEISIILSRRNTKTCRDKDPLTNLWEKIYRGVLLVDYAEKSKSRKIKSESRRQFMIVLVTAFEVYIGDIVRDLIDKNKINADKMPLPKRDVPFKEVLNLIKHKATAGETVCAFMNFQNIENLYEFLTKVFCLQPNFTDYLRKHKFKFINQDEEWQEINFEPDFDKEINKIFEDRHTFVHDISFKNTPTYEYLNFSRELIIDFAFSIEILANKFRNNRNCEILEKTNL